MATRKALKHSDDIATVLDAKILWKMRDAKTQSDRQLMGKGSDKGSDKNTTNGSEKHPGPNYVLPRERSHTGNGNNCNCNYGNNSHSSAHNSVTNVSSTVNEQMKNYMGNLLSLSNASRPPSIAVSQARRGSFTRTSPEHSLSNVPTVWAPQVRSVNE